MKRIILCIVVLIFHVSIFAQYAKKLDNYYIRNGFNVMENSDNYHSVSFRVGLGVTRVDVQYLDLRIMSMLNDVLEVSPSFMYYSRDFIDNRFIVGLDLHYNFYLFKRVVVYPIFGLSYGIYIFNSPYYGDYYDSLVYLNYGVGYNIIISRHVDVFFEVKHIDRITFSIGVTTRVF